MALQGVRVVRHGQPLLDVPALGVEAGEILAVMGPNGAGKSTLIRVLALLEAPAAGSVRFQGTLVGPGTALALRRRTASAFQQPLLADSSVFDNVAMGLRFRGVPSAEAAARVQRWLTRLGIGGLAARQARTLSGGEAQRAALARAMVIEPELLLLDEPFGALDQPTREALISDLGPILRADRVTTVLVTHDRAEALALGDRLAIIMSGRLAQVDEVAVLLRSPASEEIARFVGVETIIDCLVLTSDGSSALLRAGEATLEVAHPARPGQRVRLCLRPEDVILTAEPGPVPSGARNLLHGRVIRMAPGGAGVRVIVDCGFRLAAVVTHRSAAEMELQEGSAIAAHFSPSAAHLLPARIAMDAGTAPRLDSPSQAAV